MKVYFKWGFWILVSLFLFRILIGQSYSVDNYQMASTVLPGDRVYIGKLASGLRFPNTIFGLPGSERDYLDIIRLPYFRLPAVAKFKNHEVVAFNDPRSVDLPIDRKQLHISRIAALPSDTLIIWDKDLYINRKKVDPPETIRRIYRVVTDGSSIPEQFLADYQIEQPVKQPGVPMWDVHLDTLSYQALKDMSFVQAIRTIKMYANDSSLGYWPYSSYHIWNRDQMGPLIVPFKGHTLELSLQNIDRYRSIIENQEGQTVRISYDGVYLNEKRASTYTFKQDYYFLIDDNRDKPQDSRIIGFIPKSHLLGKVRRVIWGDNFKRILKKI